MQHKRGADGGEHVVERAAGVEDVGYAVGVEVAVFRSGYDASAQLVGIGTWVEEYPLSPRDLLHVVVVAEFVALAGGHRVGAFGDAGDLRGVVAPGEFEGDAGVEQVAARIQSDERSEGVGGEIAADEVGCVHWAKVPMVLAAWKGRLFVRRKADWGLQHDEQNKTVHRHEWEAPCITPKNLRGCALSASQVLLEQRYGIAVDCAIAANCRPTTIRPMRAMAWGLELCRTTNLYPVQVLTSKLLAAAVKSFPQISDTLFLFFYRAECMTFH